MNALLNELKEFNARLTDCGARYVLIGGLALSAHQIPRATQDIDFLLNRLDADEVDALLISLGYQCIHRSDDAANYRRGLAAIYFIYAYRPRALELIETAQTRQIGAQSLNVVTVEGIIGLKLQALTNDPRRLQDLIDIRNLIQKHRANLNLTQLYDYFLLFDKARATSVIQTLVLPKRQTSKSNLRLRNCDRRTTKRVLLNNWPDALQKFYKSRRI